MLKVNLQDRSSGFRGPMRLGAVIFAFAAAVSAAAAETAAPQPEAPKPQAPTAAPDPAAPQAPAAPQTDSKTEPADQAVKSRSWKPKATPKPGAAVQQFESAAPPPPPATGGDERHPGGVERAPSGTGE
jgi:hypothetical protein